MSEGKYQQQYGKYPGSREERKTNLTKTGQMSIGNPQNQAGYYDINLPNYGQTGMGQQSTQSQPDMLSQLRLLKSKMSYKSQAIYTPDDLDKQTSNVADQLSSLNQRLHEKSTYLGYGSPQVNNSGVVPRNRSHPVNTIQSNNRNQKMEDQPIKLAGNNYQNNSNFGGPNQSGNYNQNMNVDALPRYRQNQPNPIAYQNNQPNQNQNPGQYNQNYNQPIIQKNYYQEPTLLNNRNVNQLTFSQQQELKRQQVNQYQSLATNNPQPNNNYQQSNINPSNMAPKRQQTEETQYQPSIIKNNQQARSQQVNNQGRSQQIVSQVSHNPIDELPAVAKQQVNAIEEEQPNDEDGELEECPEGCGRQFRPVALERHIKVCKKVFQSKRKAFNSKAHRVVDQEQKQLEKQGQAKDKMIAQKKVAKKNEKDPKWKLQSEQFRQMISSNQDGEQPVQRNNALEDEYVQCSGCNRKFNQKAAEKHIPYCESKQKITAPKGKK